MNWTLFLIIFCSPLVVAILYWTHKTAYNAGYTKGADDAFNFFCEVEDFVSKMEEEEK